MIIFSIIKRAKILFYPQQKLCGHAQLKLNPDNIIKQITEK